MSIARKVEALGSPLTFGGRRSNRIRAYRPRSECHVTNVGELPAPCAPPCAGSGMSIRRKNRARSAEQLLPRRAECAAGIQARIRVRPEPGAPAQRLHQFKYVNDRQRSWLPPTHRHLRREQSKALYPYRRAARAWRPVPRPNRRQTQAPRSGSTPAGRCACLKDVSTRYALWLRFKHRNTN